MTCVPPRVRQAVVIVHGMGEQRPLEMLNRFIDAAIPGTLKTHRKTGAPAYYSRPEDVSDSYESRCYLAHKCKYYAQTDFFEYHWAHKMQGNKLGDMWSTFQHMLLRPIWRVPSGLRGIWLIFWAVILYTVWYLLNTDFEFSNVTAGTVINAVFGGSVVATAMTWLVTKFLPGKLSSTFVDVVRYLDTSPRSYAVRKSIRKGMIDFLQNLHDQDRYQRIIVVAHSLGAYIAYDGITYLWTKMNQQHCAKQNGTMDPAVIKELEGEAEKLLDKLATNPKKFRTAQRKLWKEMRLQGNPWLITDFVTVGTPMYMADQLYTRNRKDFDEKVDFRHISTCPPQGDLPSPHEDSEDLKTLNEKADHNKDDNNSDGLAKIKYTYMYEKDPMYGKGPVLYHAAPFAVVRWTNMWFPAKWGVFGDWFGGPLKPLFGDGILDIELTGNKPQRFWPAYPHTLYFKFPDDEDKDSVTKHLQNAMDLDSESWLASTLTINKCPKV